jgi:hypothetical protein
VHVAILLTVWFFGSGCAYAECDRPL